MPQEKIHRHVRLAIVVAALGYFVDIYDLVLFNIVRIPSLAALGYTGEAAITHGLDLLNVQMTGMLLGGVLWGILGDKRGRLSVLFGSIVLYSLANIANGMVGSLQAYFVLRFIAGVGLAGELGAGITLVSELLPKERRGIGTMIVATFGVSGAVLAGTIANHFIWRTCYFVGGGLGLMLLVLRIGVYESGLFSELRTTAVSRGNFFSLFTHRDRLQRYLRCIATGLPTWYMVGLLMGLAPEISKVLGVTGGPITVANTILFFYAGLTFGDFSSGALSQLLKSRNRVLLYFLVGCAVMIAAYFLVRGESAEIFYAICCLMGFTSGYWAIFVTIAAEQFGTNLRATVATTVPNFARGALVPISLLFNALRTAFKPSYGDASILLSGGIVGALCIGIALWAHAGQRETFGMSLDYVEDV